MAKETVIVPVHVLVERALPPVCAVSGQPTEKLSEFRFSDSSLLRALTAAFVRSEHRRRFVSGSVPLSDERVRARERLNLAAWIAAAGGLVAGVAGVATQTVLPITVMLILLGAATLSVMVRSMISPQGVLQGKYVWLTRVDPGFADAAVDLVQGVRRPGEGEQPVRAGIGPIPYRVLAGTLVWLFLITWITLR